jgi:hypothetical protein
LAHSPRGIVVSPVALGVHSGQHRQVAIRSQSRQMSVRGSVSMNFGGSRTSQVLAELLL